MLADSFKAIIKYSLKKITNNKKPREVFKYTTLRLKEIAILM